MLIVIDSPAPISGVSKEAVEGHCNGTGCGVKRLYLNINITKTINEVTMCRYVRTQI